jgi:tRNA(Ile)-lysidine synthase
MMKALSSKDFEEIFTHMRGAQKIALAVSGGPDSMALAWGACAVWGAKNMPAFIVEHGLRPESAAEAETVKERLWAMGLGAEILRWEHGEVDSRLHVRAREARYELLLSACRRAGADVLLLAHHKDDQAETILMRLAKGSGLWGLGGMRGETLREGVRVIRPLLNIEKKQLEATCTANDIPFVRDPSNEKEKYARGRLRRVAEALAAEGFTKDRLVDFGARAAEAADALDYYAHAFLRQSARPVAGGAIEMERGALAALPRAVVLEVLALALQALHPQTYAPERKALVRLAGFLTAEDQAGAATLHGCLVQKRKNHLLFLREPEAITEKRLAEAEKTLLWDARFYVQCPAQSEGLEIRKLGSQPRGILKSLAPELRKKVPSGRVRAGLPALWRGMELVSLPDFSCDYGGLFSVRR